MIMNPMPPDSGVATLIEMGLDQAMTSSQVELLAWHPADTDLPDAEERVLIWIEVDDSVLPVDYETGWDNGWWDGEDWRLCESGGVVDGVVTWWALPKGPRK